MAEVKKAGWSRHPVKPTHGYTVGTFVRIRQEHVATLMPYFREQIEGRMAVVKSLSFPALYPVIDFPPTMNPSRPRVLFGVIEPEHLEWWSRTAS